MIQPVPRLKSWPPLERPLTAIRAKPVIYQFVQVMGRRSLFPWELRQRAMRLDRHLEGPPERAAEAATCLPLPEETEGHATARDVRSKPSAPKPALQPEPYSFGANTQHSQLRRQRWCHNRKNKSPWSQTPDPALASCRPLIRLGTLIGQMGAKLHKDPPDTALSLQP